MRTRSRNARMNCIGAKPESGCLAEVVLNEAGTEMDIDLDERLVTNTSEAVNLTGLDHQNVSRPGLEFRPVDVPESPTGAHELHFIVRMTMRARPGSWGPVEEKCGDVHVPVIGPDEVVRAATEEEVFLTNAIHPTSP